jgi:iron(III) transport system permease protein
VRKSAALWLGLGWIGFAVLPWYLVEGGGLSLHLFGRWPQGAAGTALALGLFEGYGWLLPTALPLLAALLPLRYPDRRTADILVWAGIAGLAWMIFEGFAIGHRGWNWGWLSALFGAPGPKQAGMGYGAFLTALSFLMLLTHGLAARGFCRGDAFTVSSIGLIIALITAFVFFPIWEIMVSAFKDNDGNFAPGEFIAKFFDNSIWGLDCTYSGLRCGVAWNTLFLAILVGLGTTSLGLAFALIATRTGFRFKGLLRVLTVLPIITPPFVIGLAMILLFGRSGAVSAMLYEWFDVPRSRWVYGLPGVFLAQMLAFTPIAFLVMIGVVQGISPSLEEASQTLRAKSWTTFSTITFPLMRPGIANAFLLGHCASPDRPRSRSTPNAQR